MGFALESGYTPTSIEAMMDSVMANINVQFGTTYTTETFIGTNFYKYFYALMQRAQENEVKTSEIFEYLQQYFAITDERISRPVVTNPGLLDALETAGYVASIKKPIDADAGKIFVAVDVSDGDHAVGSITITSYANLIAAGFDTVTVGATVFTAQAGAATLGTATFQAATSNAATATSLAAQIQAHATAGALVQARASGALVTIHAIHGGTAGNAIALGYADNGTATIGATKSGTALSGGTASATYAADKTAIANVLLNSTVAGTVTQGSETTAIALSNGQSFDFKFALPDRITTLLRLTITTSENNQVVILSPDDIKQVLLANIAARYQLGKNFEPQRYFSLSDAPWASNVLLEWSTDGGTTYYSTVYDSDFDELYTVSLANITLVEL